MEQIDLKQLIKQYPEVLTDGTKLKAYILDLYPQCKRGMVNILVAIQQCGIVAEMQASKNPSALDMSRWKKVLDDDYGIAGATAETCLQMWCSAVGVQLEIKVSAEQKTNTARPKVQNDKSQSKQSSVEVGDIYTFGTYQQDNDTSNGNKPIKWLVLAKEGSKILLISEKGLDCQKYNDTYADVTWETCSLRKWLNNDFINAAFSSDEKAMISTAKVSADKNPSCNTNPGNATNDKVFLLSIKEAENYFSSDSARHCKPTKYAVANGAYVNNSNGNCWWWLRTPGIYQSNAVAVFYTGSICDYGDRVDLGCFCVRPALWINLES